MAMFDYSGPKFDFAPLANLADPIIDQMEKRRAGEELQKYVAAQLGGQSLAGLAPAAAPAAPSMGAAMAPSQRAMRMPADPETERKFLATVAEGGLTNPIGRAALAAHVNAESGFSPANFTRTWSDPSESGQPGTSGGALSWRGDRLTKMLQATRGSEDPVVAQAKYALVENPDVTMALQNAKSLEEAHSVLANSQRYAGYDRPGGENARRLALAQNYLPKVGGSEVANLPIAGGAAAQFVVPQGDRTPATTEVKPGVGQGPAAVGSGVSPEQRARIMAGVASTVPAVRAAALAELHQIVQPKNPMSLGNGILYDPRTGKVQDFSNTQKPPEEYRKYLLERSDPGFAAHQEIERQTKDPKQKVESAYDVEQAKTYQELFKHTQEEGRNSAGTLGNLRAMDRLIDNPDFYSGTGGSAATAIKRALVSIGVKDAKSAQPNELFEKLANRALLDASGGKLGAGFSNADREFMGRTAANIENTPQGNRAIISMAKQVEGRKQEIAGMARDYARSHGGRLDSGFDEQMAKYAEANPLFAEQGPAIPDNLPAPRGPSYLPPGLPPPGTPSSERKTPTGVRWSF
jgi:hypothetical protein